MLGPLTKRAPEFIELYDPTITTMNVYTGGPYQQAVSGLSFINNDWYDGKQYQTYAFEYTPGSDGSVTWRIGGDKVWKLDARSLRPNGNIGQRIIPAEPMALVMNFGMSEGFAQLNFTGLGKSMPARMRFDYVRIYQDPNAQNLGCDPSGFPTADYINDHPEPYTNVNLTSWSKTPYDWPQNALKDGCSAAVGSVPIKSS